MREYEILKIARMITENPDEIRTPPTSPGGLDDLDGFGDLPEDEDFQDDSEEISDEARNYMEIHGLPFSDYCAIEYDFEHRGSHHRER
jgi:hypothetical protein